LTAIFWLQSCYLSIDYITPFRAFRNFNQQIHDGRFKPMHLTFGIVLECKVTRCIFQSSSAAKEFVGNVQWPQWRLMSLKACARVLFYFVVNCLTWFIFGFFKLHNSKFDWDSKDVESGLDLWMTRERKDFLTYQFTSIKPTSLLTESEPYILCWYIGPESLVFLIKVKHRSWQLYPVPFHFDKMPASDELTVGDDKPVATSAVSKHAARCLQFLS